MATRQLPKSDPESPNYEAPKAAKKTVKAEKSGKAGKKSNK